MGDLYVVGIGPGKISGMTIEAYECLNRCDVIAGFVTYVKLVEHEFSDKEFLTTGMGSEQERCQLALEAAKTGKMVALVCSGDSSVYGMAGLVYELSAEYPEVDIHVIAGVTAALSGSALLGAVAGHDFACVSLSDYMITWEQIENRLIHLAKADMVIALYNVRSKKRPDALKNACSVLLKELSPDTVCGVAVNIGRAEEYYKLMTLSELKDYEADMFTTAFIGNSFSKIINNKLVTPRGYLINN